MITKERWILNEDRNEIWAGGRLMPFFKDDAKLMSLAPEMFSMLKIAVECNAISKPAVLEDIKKLISQIEV